MPQVILSLCLFLLIGVLGSWVTPASAKTLRAGVPAKSPNPKFVNVKCKDSKNETCFSGHSINVFRMVWKNLNNSEDYEFIPYDGPYDSLIKEVPNGTFDLVVGDTSIVARRCEYVEFSRPYSEVGARMVVPEKREGRAWIFVKPFTITLWGVTCMVFLYNAIVVWLIETADAEEKHSLFGDLSWLTVTTLFPIRGEKLKSKLSKMAMLGWLFTALVLLQSYTASLTSMLTVRRLRPSVVDVESLLKGKAMVGCDSGSFMRKYLQEVVGFDSTSIKEFNSSEYAPALFNGTIKAAFLEIPNLQLFLDENPKGFIAAGPTYEIGGHAFVFPKRSDLVEQVSLEILKLREKGILRTLEQGLLSHNRSTLDFPDDDQDSLSPDEFLGLFLITITVSTVAFLLFLVGRHGKKWRGKNSPKVQPARLERIHDVGDPGLHLNMTKLRDLRRCNTV